MTENCNAAGVNTEKRILFGIDIIPSNRSADAINKIDNNRFCRIRTFFSRFLLRNTYIISDNVASFWLIYTNTLNHHVV